MDDKSFATELLHEMKQGNKRWFVAFVVVLCLWFATIGGFIWYISLPVEEISIESEDGNANYIGDDLNGDLYNGEDNDKAPQTR